MKKFNLCLNTSTIRPASLMEKIKIAGEVGYDAIELWNDDLTDFEEKTGSLDDVVTALDDNGLSVATVIALHGWLDSTGQKHHEAIDEAKRKIEQAAKVGATYIIASPPLEEVDLIQGGKHYRELLEIAQEFGVKPAMEFLGFVKGVNQIKHAWEIATRADHPDSSIILDSFHVFRGGGSIEELKQIPGDKIAIFHINDAPSSPSRLEQSDADRVFPGDGILPLAETVRILQSAGYNGAISVELFNPEYWEKDLWDVAKIGLDKTLAVLEEV